MAFDIPALPLTSPGLLFAVLVAAILLSPMLARRLRLPEVVVVLLVGFAIGPTGLGVVQRVGVVQVLGGVGLLYLMFVAGLELDLDDFVENRRGSIGFGVATFVVPIVLGTFSALALGYGWLAAILLGSCWASHTLVTYPIFQRTGTVSNRAVATSVGATIITDTAALLVLAIVARAYQGELSVVFWLTLLPSLALLVFGTLAGLPRLAKWFFSGFGQDRSLRFLFVMVAMLTVASLAQISGIEPIVGAFLAGLALNRSVPNGGPLMERIEFLGSTLFIPLFLLSTGMLIDLQVLLDPRTLLIGAAFTAVALVGKYLAAAGSGALLRYSTPEIGAMFALSAAQAAATLAAIVVGLNIGLLDQETVNAVMLVILVTCVVAPAVAARAAPLLPRPARDRDLGEVVVVPVANPTSAPRLMRIASAFARTDGGMVVPVMVAPPSSEPSDLDSVRQLDTEVLRTAHSAGAEARSVLRIDSTPAAGIAHTVVEQQASLVILGWKGSSGRPEAMFGGIIDEVLARTFVPTLLSWEGNVPPDRVLLVIDEAVTTPAGRRALELGVVAARLLARDGNLDVAAVGNHLEDGIDAVVTQRLGTVPKADRRRLAGLVRAHGRGTDLIVVPTVADEPTLRSIAARVAAAAPQDASLVVALDTSPVAAAPEVDLAEQGKAP